MGASSFLASFYLVCGIVMFLLAVTILRQSGRSAISWFTALVLFFASFGPLLGAIGFLLERNLTEGTVLFKSLVESFAYVWEFFFPALVLFTLVYPRRHRLWPYIRKWVWVLFLPHFFHLMLIIVLIPRVDPEHVFSRVAELPIAISAVKGFVTESVGFLNFTMKHLIVAHKQLFSLVDVAYAGFSMIILVNALRGDLSPRVRRQVRVLLGGLGLCIITFSVARVISALSGTEAQHEVAAGMQSSRNISAAFINAALIIGGGSIAWAIVRYQFLDMRVIGRRGILFVAAATIAASIYLIIVRQLMGFFRQSAGGGGADILETGLIILFIIAFQPVLGRLEDWSERLVPERHDPRARIRALSGELLSMIDVGAMKDRVSAVLREIFETEDAELVLASEALDEGGVEVGARSVFGTLAKVGEPIIRADLLEALGYLDARSNLVSRRGRKRAREIVASLPGPVRRYAHFELIVPVMHGKECVAAICLGSRKEFERYSAEEQSLLSLLASQVSASLQNIQLLKEVVEKRVLEEELNIARSIQLNLLPSVPPELERYEVSALSVSSKQVGGDYYDFLHRRSFLAIAVADVSGKGVPASLLMASLQASLRSNMDRMEHPVELVSRLNTMMCEATTEDKFATLFYGCLNMDHDQLDYTNAGHVFPVMLRSNGRIEILEYSGLILGVIPDFKYEHQCLNFAPGDTLVVTSDGVTEAQDSAGNLFGEARFQTFLPTVRGTSAREVRDSIVETVKSFSHPKGAGDDLTILVLRRRE